MKTHGVLIIGSGPAGIACAIQLSRTRKDIIVIEKEDRPGGLIRNGHRVENFPAISPCSGQKLASELGKQLYLSTGEYIRDEIYSISDDGPSGLLISGINGEYRASRVVIASGTVPVMPPIEGLDAIGENFIHTGHLTVENGSGERFAVLGGGDAAYDQSISLKKKGYDVVILQRGESRALSILQTQAEELGIEIRKGAFPTEIRRVGKALLLREGTGPRESVGGVLIACGRRPSPLSEYSGISDKVYTAGDISAGQYRQAVIAFADGLKTAMIIGEDGKKGNIKNSGK